MPRATTLSLRLALDRMARLGATASDMGRQLGLPLSTVRGLTRRARQAGPDRTSAALQPRYHACGPRPLAAPPLLETTRLLAELHRDSLYPMMGKDAWVAGADRREAPGPKPVRLGRRLRLRRQPPESWQLCNGGVQRGVSCNFFIRAATRGLERLRDLRCVRGRPATTDMPMVPAAMDGGESPPPHPARIGKGQCDEPAPGPLSELKAKSAAGELNSGFFDSLISDDPIDDLLCWLSDPRTRAIAGSRAAGRRCAAGASRITTSTPSVTAS